MPTEYIILSDASFTLSVGQDKLLPKFTLPDGAILAGKHRPILAFVVNPNPGVEPIQFKVDCNDSQQVSATMRKDQPGGMWEVIASNVAVLGDNTIQFRVTSGTGNVVFRDVVVWYNNRFEGTRRFSPLPSSGALNRATLAFQRLVLFLLPRIGVPGSVPGHSPDRLA
jgi:hypothetical protein